MSGSHFLVDWRVVGREFIEWVNPYADSFLVWLSDAQHRVRVGATGWFDEVPELVVLVGLLLVNIAVVAFAFRVYRSLVLRLGGE